MKTKTANSPASTPADQAPTTDDGELSLEEQLLGVNAKTGPYLRSGRSLRRVKGFKGAPSNCFHVMSRTCGGQVFWDDVEKEALRRIMWRLAEFCGVRVLTYCVMSNHFHTLVEVPKREPWLERFAGGAGSAGEEALFKHLRVLYSKAFVDALREEFTLLRGRGQETMVQFKLEMLKKRFCDVAVFMREMKVRFSRWYNKRHGRKGTLWMDRFRSVLVEGKGDPLLTMAAYIDLNPVRAGIVNDPKDYRWCGYAEALGGSKECQRGLCKVTAQAEDAWTKERVQDRYRQILFDAGREVRSADKSAITRRGVSAERVKEVLAKRGKLTLGELVRCKVRYFADGAVIGSKAFVNAFFEEHRQDFGANRKDGARHIGDAEGDLHSLRDLKRHVVRH